MKAAVLGVGTELTQGQILNRNAQWISAKMKALGLDTSVHLVVPDDRKMILEGLQFCSTHADLLFVTGGLGPTTDDFTRDLIAEWAQVKMKFDEPSWQHIQERLGSRGIPVREAQRQQCYFPEDSTILFNKNGTANGFSLDVSDKKVYVLPGPPNEIEGIWNDTLATEMKVFTKKIDAAMTEIWDCLGQGESEIAHLAEGALQGSGLEIGYRVHLPYVEVKVSSTKSQQPEVRPWLNKLDLALKPYTVLRHGEDAAELLCKKMAHFKDILIVDELTGSHLFSRVFPHAKNLLHERRLHYSTDLPASTEGFDLVLHLAPMGPSDCRAVITHRAQSRLQLFRSPYERAVMHERQKQYFAEVAMLFWLQEIIF